MAVVFQGIEGEKKGRMVIGCASVLRLGHGNTKTLLSFFPNNIGAKHFLRAKTLNSSNLTTTRKALVTTSVALVTTSMRSRFLARQASFWPGHLTVSSTQAIRSQEDLQTGRTLLK